ncbi:MAG: hypothetical protein V4793_44100 [Paraburkholderia tropica]|uniref:hypothetical protein n=1 Tax=Paraburkholderia tropica TaxID=92647 RepID=UPI00310169DE
MAHLDYGILSGFRSLWNPKGALPGKVKGTTYASQNHRTCFHTVLSRTGGTGQDKLARKFSIRMHVGTSQKLADAAVAFIVCGTLEPHRSLPQALRPSLDMGLLNQATHDSWVGTANSMHGSNPTFQRDEVIRSVPLAAITLIFAAQAKGLAAGPVIGVAPQGRRA